ncbi:MAG TPA: helix-hairpin-helix domain-containing protein, partial [Chitinophagaceae bacterium]|nr:helix-hairpin-helix domain-containing protein [Chitinophagaceae bacterium]
MRKALFIYFFIWIFCYPDFLFGQELPITTQQQLENMTDADQNETEDDNYLLELEQFRKNPINLNTADADDLKLLRVLTDLQIDNLISYRNFFGNLISIYELQAIPAWEILTIKKLLPFITIATPINISAEALKRFRSGEHSLL